MKYMKYLGVALVTIGLLVGCGSNASSTTETTDDSSDTIEKGTGYYIDDVIAGVTYVCGTENNVTGEDGSFTFDINESCTFSINGITLRTVEKGDLEKNGTNIFEDNTTVAQFLQSLDEDGNSSNGLRISEEVITHR